MAPNLRADAHELPEAGKSKNWAGTLTMTSKKWLADAIGMSPGEHFVSAREGSPRP